MPGHNLIQKNILGLGRSHKPNHIVRNSTHNSSQIQFLQSDTFVMETS